jgi:hypothetical protein
MATVLEESATEEQHSLFVFLWAKELSANNIHKEMFLVYGWKYLSVKWFATGSRNSLKDVRKSQMTSDQMRKWLRQQSNDLYAAGFDVLVKRWDKCVSVGGGYVRK